MDRRLPIVAVVLACSAVACANDEPGDMAAFCAEAQDRDGRIAAGAALAPLVETAPPEIAAELDRLVGAFDEIVEVGAADPRAEQLATDPEVLAAARRLRSYLGSECGIDLATLDEPVSEAPTATGDQPLGDAEPDLDPDAPAVAPDTSDPVPEGGEIDGDFDGSGT